MEVPFQIDLAQSFPHLSNAPIVEAVIHWRARAGIWQDADALRRLVTARLPEYPDCHPQHKLEMTAEVSVDGSTTQFRNDTFHGFRLTAADKLHILQFTRDGVIFSRLTPYEHWEEFVAEGWRLWRVFVELTKPPEVQRLGVRFINRIAVNHPADVSQWLSSPPECLESIGIPTVGFLYQSRHELPGHPFQINVVRTIQPPSPEESGELGLLVDIDVGTTHSLPCDDTILQDRLRQMRWLKNKVFFSLLTAQALGRLPAGKK